MFRGEEMSGVDRKERGIENRAVISRVEGREEKVKKGSREW